MIRPTLLLLLSTLTLSCGGSPSKPNPLPQPTAGQVDLSIASVTLADDCGTGPTGAPVASEQPSSGDSAKRDSSMLVGTASRSARVCEQSSVQLRVANKTSASSKITIKRIELLDASGAVIGELTPRDASQWSSDTYQPWDEQVAANQTLQVSYALSRPAVSAGGTYTVRLVVASGDGDETTLEQRKTLQAEASLPPDAVT